jgi:hypothetical protein
VAQRKGQGGTPKKKVVELVEQTYNKHRISLKNANEETTLAFMRELRNEFKTMKLPNQYEHSVQISANISNKPPGWNEDDQVNEKVERMFLDAVAAWHNAPPHIRKKRYSFPNYKDFIKRCLIYLGYHKLSKTIRGLKTPMTIRDMNKIWGYFMNYCNWPGAEVAMMCEYG